MDNKIWEQKDKRITFLALLHDLAILNQGSSKKLEDLWAIAKKATEQVFVEYPIPTEEKPHQEPIRASGSVLCPVCGSIGIPNTAGKLKNPKSPDFKCSQEKGKCKFQKDRMGKWIPSDYITGWWEEKKEDLDRGMAEDNIWDEASHNV